ncbi:hypothetical protein D9619_009261 [Psilocybe cf. subviscida]|uniref:NACHT domain-containing protein n=1 Tax=Psilocybe cf. subviscida TaxID=2480587 RepID=A0A8H5FAM4_9AGAR|nr:hypothetical protein D9619_009261 [Psilocybe cf. subviscida]
MDANQSLRHSLAPPGYFWIGPNVLTVNVNTSKQSLSDLDRLYNEVAPNAILNAGGRADEIRCYPGTREEVISKIEKWMDGHSDLSHRMMWLSGPAGAGKSAIAQSLAERLKEHRIPSANFFFFRGDDTRNNSQPLVATLVYQLRNYYPALNELLADCLTATPFICEASIDEQFKQLISSPLRIIRHSSSIHGPIILIIDGVDECDNERKQEQILGALHVLVTQDNSPFRVLVASRAEPNLVMSFNRIGSSAKSIFLDNEYSPQDDIRRFVVAKFDEIKGVHHLAHTLSKDWPAETDIDAITSKSSGQFIYAATVMRYIEYSTASPALSLLTVLGMQPSAGHSPLAQLDAVYSYIFSKAHDIQAVKLILGAYLLVQTKEMKALSNSHQLFPKLLKRLGYGAIEIASFLGDLTAIISFTSGPPKKLVFYHASLFDYLVDKSRSGIYYVDVRAIAAEWTLICFKELGDWYSWHVSIVILNHVDKATSELSKSLLDASKQNLNNTSGSTINSPTWGILMLKIYKLYFDSDRALYKDTLRHWMRFAYINNVARYLPDNYTGETPINRHISKYYYWYLVTEGLKSVVRPHA